MRHLLSVDDLEPGEIDELLDLAEQFVGVNARDIPKLPALRGKVVATIFYEESTRTRVSFETAAKRLSADVMSLNVAGEYPKP